MNDRPYAAFFHCKKCGCEHVIEEVEPKAIYAASSRDPIGVMPGPKKRYCAECGSHDIVLMPSIARDIITYLKE